MHVASGSLDGSTVQEGQVEALRLSSKPAHLANLYLLPTCVSEKKRTEQRGQGSMPSTLLLDCCISSQDRLESFISELKETDAQCGLGDVMVSVTGGGGMRGTFGRSPHLCH